MAITLNYLPDEGTMLQCLQSISIQLKYLKELKIIGLRTILPGELSANNDEDSNNDAILIKMTKLTICAEISLKTAMAIVRLCPNVKELTVLESMPASIALLGADLYNLDCLYLIIRRARGDYRERYTESKILERHPKLKVKVLRVPDFGC